ncbi:DUF6075 family protein [Alkaliphilus serpentinus]|uniref:DUF6075 family protein n=1 Tax=Alkaliphilus serpentinus TaxID=1482731 RepID=UPI0038B8CF58
MTHRESVFLSQQHKLRYEELLLKDNTRNRDSERYALFFLLAGNDDLYQKRNSIYNFSEHQIRLCLSDDKVDFSSGCEALIRLGFNLYNRYRDECTTPLELLSNLDEENQLLALNAMALRFS